MSHGRFDALSGAVLLGEASEAERAEFARHASTCEQCRADVQCAPVLVGAIEVARDAETWRPRVDRAVLGRIRDSRTSRFRVTIGALGWAVAISIVLNVAFATGLSARFFGGFGATAETNDRSTATMLSLESPAPRLAGASARHRARVAFAPRREHVARAITQQPVAAVRRPPAKPSEPAVAVPDIPDVLAGLDIDGNGDRARHVAVQEARPCDARENEPAATQDPTAPCPIRSAADLPH